MSSVSVLRKAHHLEFQLPQKRKREAVLGDDLDVQKGLCRKLRSDSQGEAKAKSVEQKFSWLNDPCATDARGRPKDVRPLPKSVDLCGFAEEIRRILAIACMCNTKVSCIVSEIHCLVILTALCVHDQIQE
jgi:hypothetical protein